MSFPRYESEWSLCKYIRTRWSDSYHKYNGRRIYPSFGYVTVRGEGKVERERGRKMENRLSEHVYYFFLVTSTHWMAFWKKTWLVHYTLFREPQEVWNTVSAGTYFNTRALLLQPNVIISHLTVHEEGLGYLRTFCRFAVFSSSPHVIVTVVQARSYFASGIGLSPKTALSVQRLTPTT
jgi:hypothetical protein